MTVGPTSYDLPIYEDFFSFLPLEKAPPIYLHEFQTRKLKSFRAFIIIWENIRYKGGQKVINHIDYEPVFKS